MSSKYTSTLCCYKFVVLFLILGVINIPTPIHAQNRDYISNDITITISPEYPTVSETVLFTLHRSQDDFSRSQIIWTVGGKEEERNTTSFSTVAPSISQQSKIVRVQIIENNNTEYTYSHTIKPHVVDILWEASTYTPRWYPGKNLYTPRSTVRFKALPYISTSNGTVYDPDDLYYVWQQDGYDLVEKQGVGLHTTDITLSPRARTRVGVRVSSPDKNYVAQEEIDLVPQDVDVLVYPIHPLWGIQFNTAVDQTYDLSEREVTFVAFPFFFDVPRATTAKLEYVWELNNIEIDGNVNEQTFRQEDETSGQANISVDIEHTQNLLQDAFTTFTTAF